MFSAAGWFLQSTSLHAGFALRVMHADGLYGTQSSTEHNGKAGRSGSMCARTAVEQNEDGFAGIQHNRDDHETYAVVLPYDFLCNCLGSI